MTGSQVDFRILSQRFGPSSAWGPCPCQFERGGAYFPRKIVPLAPQGVETKFGQKSEDTFWTVSDPARDFGETGWRRLVRLRVLEFLRNLSHNLPPELPSGLGAYFVLRFGAVFCPQVLVHIWSSGFGPYLVLRIWSTFCPQVLGRTFCPGFGPVV